MTLTCNDKINLLYMGLGNTFFVRGLKSYIIY